MSTFKTFIEKNGKKNVGQKHIMDKHANFI